MLNMMKVTGLSCLLVLVFAVNSVTAFEPMLPQTYTREAAVEGWWMSEKLDGIRG